MIFSVCIEIQVSGNFSEIAWWAIQSRQVTHDNSLVYGFPRWNRLAAHTYPPDDSWCSTQF